MNNNVNNIKQIIDARNVMIKKQKDLYISAIEKINMGTRELLKNDFGSTLVNNTMKDLAGEVVRRFFDLGDYYITVDQLYERFTHFSYDNDVDLFSSEESIRKAYYNYSDSIGSESLSQITKRCDDAQRQLFTDNRAQDNLDIKGKKQYREDQIKKDGKLYDELTGQEGTSHTIIKNGKEVQVSDLQADHVQAREAIKYNERYIRAEKVNKLKEFYNSADNMQMMHASANASKGDVRVCEVDGKVEYLNAKEMKNRQQKGENICDITHKATARQLADATISQWEKETKSGNKIEALKEKGYLDEQGKVKPGVREELEQKIKHSQNAESIEILHDTNYSNVTKDALKDTKKSMKKILSGQVIYYVLPPLVFETQSILKRKDITLDTFFSEINEAGKRITKYVSSKMGDILKNITGNAISKFIKTFFDIVIEMVKATVKKLIKILKDVVMSLVNCIKVLTDKNASASQKADSITKILSATITTVIMELLFEYLEKQFGLPDFLMEPLQIIVTVLATNIIMLVLQKMDLFDVQYGLLVANIEKLFDEENQKYLLESEALYQNDTQLMDQLLEDIKLDMNEIEDSITNLDIYENDATSYLDEISKIFDMRIDFNKEWDEFLGLSL